MVVRIKPGALREGRWYEYGIRFLFGGLVTVAAGLVAHRFGPALGGLFLAFPAIFPASATLIEKHEVRKKRRLFMRGEARGKGAAAMDASGAAIGAIGLIAFGAVVWLLAPRAPAWQLLGVAAGIWAMTSASGWALRKKLRCRLRARHARQHYGGLSGRVP